MSDVLEYLGQMSDEGLAGDWAEQARAWLWIVLLPVMLLAVILQALRRARHNRSERSG
jgi:hypothetical protein